MKRPLLAPGLRVLRHSRDELQVGLDPERRLRLPDTEPVRRTLGALLRGEAPPDDPGTRRVLDALAPVLVEGEALIVPGIAEGDVAAAALHDPAAYPARVAARRAARIAVTGSLGEVDPAPLLSPAGLGVARSPTTGATHVLVLSAGEIDRDDLDPLVRDRLPHLLVRIVEGTATVGPFVDPGHTACLRCLDAHRTLRDPRAATMATLHARAARDRCDGVAEPVDSALATLAVAWAVRDLVSHVEGDRPTTWSATVELTAGLRSVVQTEWLRHPACGCGWLTDEGPSRTMEA
jgi:bacteriocin biosynthesis cyclodehydratase domain-containing protein